MTKEQIKLEIVNYIKLEFIKTVELFEIETEDDIKAYVENLFSLEFGIKEYWEYDYRKLIEDIFAFNILVDITFNYIYLDKPNSITLNDITMTIEDMVVPVGKVGDTKFWEIAYEYFERALKKKGLTLDDIDPNDDEVKNIRFAPVKGGKKIKDSHFNKEEEYQELFKLLTNIQGNDEEQPFLFDAISEYKDFFALHDIMEGDTRDKDKEGIIVLTYLYNELEEEQDNWNARLAYDKARIDATNMFKTKVASSPEKEDAKYLIIFSCKEDKDTTIYLGDSRLTRKMKVWYAGKIEEVVDPKFLRRNYRLSKIKEGKK